MGPVAILLLAAGASTRMRGGDKLLQEIDGEPVLRRQAKAALATGAPIYVALPLDRPERDRALEGFAVHVVPVPDAAEGMSASIRCGVAALLPGTAGVAILPADMPELTAEDLRAVLEAFAGDITRATSEDGTPGHPVIFPSTLYDEMKTLTGDTGARKIMRGRQVKPVPLPLSHALTDLDTPEEWAAWHANRKRTG